MTGENLIRRAWARRARPSSRRGAAVVEMAVVTPILLGLILGIMEYGWLFMVKSNLTNATREAARVGILPGATDTDIRNRFDAAISPTGLGLGSYTVVITQPDSSATLKTLSVKVLVPWSDVSLFGALPHKMLGFVSNASGQENTGNMVASCSMLKEGTQ